MISKPNLPGSYSLIAYPNRVLVVSEQQNVAKLRWYENSEDVEVFLRSVDLPRHIARKIQTAHTSQQVIRIPDVALTSEQLVRFGG